MTADFRNQTNLMTSVMLALLGLVVLIAGTMFGLSMTWERASITYKNHSDGPPTINSLQWNAASTHLLYNAEKQTASVVRVVDVTQDRDRFITIGREPQWSIDGHEIAVTIGSNWYVFGPECESELQHTGCYQLDVLRRDDPKPDWIKNPEQSDGAYIKHGDVFVEQANGRSKRVTFTPLIGEELAELSPDETQVAFVVAPDELYIIDLKTDELTYYSIFGRRGKQSVYPRMPYRYGLTYRQAGFLWLLALVLGVALLVPVLSLLGRRLINGLKES